MCGIIAYSGKENAKDMILRGLRSLEYRGYDSAGLTVFADKKAVTVKTAGRVAQLEQKTEKSINSNNYCGIGHTRWATHGKPSEINAHPHGTEKLMIVHNGIIENYKELRALPEMAGYSFSSETDTEVAAKIIDSRYTETKDPISAIISASSMFKGSYAICVVFSDIPDTVFAIKKDSPLILGKGVSGNFLASDISAFNPDADSFYRIADGEITKITATETLLFSSEGKAKEISWQKLHHCNSSENKRGYKHFMLKEINEEPAVMQKTFDSMVSNYQPDFSSEFSSDFFKGIGRIHIAACGTAYHAGLIGKYYIEKLSSIPVNAETASEFRYGNPIIGKRDVVIIISQSGETADSLAVLRLMKKRNIPVVAIVNTEGSAIGSESDYVIHTLAGKEIAVASTKAFNVQILSLLIFACKLALENDKMQREQCSLLIKKTENEFACAIPQVIKAEKEILKAAHFISQKKSAFFIGRGCDSYLALEASLKLKEISYINSQAYPAGELKHGTISLIEKDTPVIALATNKDFYEKMRSNIEEVKSRGAFIISVCPENTDIITEISDIAITLPPSEPMLHPFTAATAVQLLSYHTANCLGRDIDKPRNLAKSVTVE